MKKYLLFVVLLVSSVTLLSGQTLVINQTSGSAVQIDLDKLSKVSFSDGKMVANYSDGTDESYVLSEVSKLVFSGTTGIGVVEAMDGKLAYSGSRGIAVVANSTGSKLQIYNIGGSVVLQKTIEAQVETVDLSSLQRGLYLLKLDGKTIKIVR